MVGFGVAPSVQHALAERPKERQSILSVAGTAPLISQIEAEQMHR
jgi:hypothetical protein